MKPDIEIETPTGYWSYNVTEQGGKFLISGVRQVIKVGSDTTRTEFPEVADFRSLRVFDGPSSPYYWEGALQLVLRESAKTLVDEMVFFNTTPIAFGSEVRYFGDMARTVLWGMNLSPLLVSGGDFGRR